MYLLHIASILEPANTKQDCNQDLRSSTDPLAGGEQDIYNDDLEPSSDTSTSYPKEDTHSSFRPSSFQVQNSLNAVNESPPANQMRSPSQMPEEIEQDTATTPISPFLLALGLWFEKTDSSRQDYIRLRQILLLNEHPEHQALPLKLDTLKRHVRAHLPLLKMYRKLLTVMIEKQPSIAARQKSRTRPTVRIVRQTWMYWFDPVHLACSILNSDLKNKMHTGMAHYVDEPTELWHSLAWGSSIRACSGEICQSPGGEHILPGDIVCINNIYTADQQHISRARVTFIGRDYRSNAQALGTILLTCQAVVSLHQLRDCEAVYNTLARNHHPQELFLIENESFELPPDRVEYIDNILLDYSTFADDDVLDTEFLSSFIRRVVNTSTEEIRALRTSHPTRGELECAEYGRDYLVTNLVTELVTSLPLILFIDDFPVHRNMYRSLKAFYWIPASLPYHERRKIANVFTLTLGPHGADLKDVIRCLEDSCAELAKGTWIDDVGRVVCAFPMLLVGDMPQQADNSGFLRHNAIYGCRQCFCTKGERADLSFDISTSGRYHFDTVQDRELAKDLPSGQRRRFLQERGMHLEAPPMAKLAPALDLIRSRPADAPHSEWRGLGRILQGLLFSSIFTKRGSSAFLRHFQTFPYPPGWPRIQSPLYYIMSWSLSEAGRATVLTPLILRAYSQTGWYRVQFLTAITQQFPPSTTLSPIDQLIQAYGIIAICNTYTCTERYSEPDAIHNHILRSREAYQRLIRCADGACEGPHRRTNIDGDDLDQGPENVIEQALNQGGSETEHSASVNEDSNPFQARRLPSTSQRRRRQEQNRYRRLLSLPNVHQGLHYADVVREYAIVMNCNVLAGELKHKSVIIKSYVCVVLIRARVFKHMADIAAPPNLMGYMFAKENVKQSMRLGFAGAWRDNEALHEAITVLSESCTALASSFIPQGEQDVGREDPGSTTVHGDLVHQHISATIPRLTLSLYIQALFQIRSTGHSYDISPLPLSHPFMLQLRKALARDYNINNVMRLKGRIQWKQRLAYTDPYAC